MKNTRLLTIFAIVFVDLLGFSLILPLLPFYAEQYGATPMLVGLLVASYAAAQLIGAPLLGRLSDRYGRRPILLLSVAGTFGGFLLLGFADPVGRFFSSLVAPGFANMFIVGILFISRILDGLTGGNITVAQAYIADVTDEKNRAKGLGMIGAAFGLGFIIGPAVGGALSRISYSTPAFAAASVSFLNLLLIALFLSKSLNKEQRAAIAQRQRPPFTLKALLQTLQRPKVGPLLYVRFFYGLAFATFQSIFALYAQAIGLSFTNNGLCARLRWAVVRHCSGWFDRYPYPTLQRELADHYRLVGHGRRAARLGIYIKALAADDRSASFSALRWCAQHRDPKLHQQVSQP